MDVHYIYRVKYIGKQPGNYVTTISLPEIAAVWADWSSSW